MEKVINFYKYRYFAYSFSILLCAFFLIATYVKGGFIMGVDFAGGTKILAKFEDKSINEEKIKKVLNDFKPSVQQIGSEENKEFIINTKLEESEAKNIKGTEQIKSILSNSFKDVKFMSIEKVGPAIGDYLRKSAVKIVIISIILMSIYLAFRFEVKFAVGAMIALVHDISLSIAFSGFMGIEVNIGMIAALLTIFGFSVNDTIVIFDRIRENVQVQSKQTFTEILNKSVTQCLSRTYLTSLTVLYSTITLYILGGEGINDFALILIFGFIIGMYSTIYIASPVVVTWEHLVAKFSK